MSADGRYVTFNCRDQRRPCFCSAFVRDRLARHDRGPEHQHQPHSASRVRKSRPTVASSSSPATALSCRATQTASTDLFVRDRLTGTTDRVSVGSDGTQSDDFTFIGQISRDGRFVAFQTLATTLLGPGGDTNGINDIYVRDRLTNVTKRVSVAYNGAQATVGTAPDRRVDRLRARRRWPDRRLRQPRREPPAARHRHQRQGGRLRPRRQCDRPARRRQSALRQQSADRHRPRGAEHRHEHGANALPGDPGRRRQRHGGLPPSGVCRRYGGLSRRVAERRRRRHRHGRRALARQRQRAEPRRRGDGRSPCRRTRSARSSTSSARTIRS